MPTSDLNEEFTFNFIITDKAGNTLNIPPQRFLFDDQMGNIRPLQSMTHVSVRVLSRGFLQGTYHLCGGSLYSKTRTGWSFVFPELTGNHTVTAASPF
jgi:hypothetical protein